MRPKLLSRSSKVAFCACISALEEASTSTMTTRTRAALALSTPRALASLSNYTRLVRTDMSPCERPLRPRGTAATTRPTLAQPQGGQQPFVGGGAVRRHVRLRGFYWNGWSKGCGNASRGTTFEPGAGDSFYLTPSVAACRMCSRCMCPAYVF